MDTVALVDVYPCENERILATEIVRSGGGPAAVAAVTLSRLGIKTAIVGTIGNDSDGKEVMAIFEKEGVDTTGISIGIGATSSSVIVASRENSARAISTRQPLMQAPINNAAKSLISSATWVHVDQVGIKQLREINLLRGTGPLISFDAGYGVENFDAATVDLFVPTEDQMKLRYPAKDLCDAVTTDATKASNIVVATQGSSGSTGYSSESGLVSAPGFPGEIVSTLGAGDVFHGALLAQLIQGQSLQNALFGANATAVLSCRGLDGQSKIPTSSELAAFLKVNL